VRGWLVRKPTRAARCALLIEARRAVSLVRLFTKSAVSQRSSGCPTRKFRRSYAGSFGLKVKTFCVYGPPMLCGANDVRLTVPEARGLIADCVNGCRRAGRRPVAYSRHRLRHLPVEGRGGQAAWNSGTVRQAGPRLMPATTET